MTLFVYERRFTNNEEVGSLRAGKMGVSKLRGLTGGVATQRLVSHHIEFACLDIALKLAIPGPGIERSVPGTECRKFCGRKLLNLLFDCFDFAHVPPSRKNTSMDSRSQPLQMISAARR